MRVIFYYSLLTLVLVYALARGGQSERAGAAILFIGSVLTDVAFVPGILHFISVERGVLAVDVAVLAGFVILALRSDRYWPLWLAALQLIGTLAHFAKLADSTMMPVGYAFLLAVWAYPMLALIGFGTWSRHRRSRRTSGS